MRHTNKYLPPDTPVCRIDQKRVYGVAKEERANVLCQVDAYPPPDEFHWSFNNTASTQEVLTANITNYWLQPCMLQKSNTNNHTTFV